MNTCIEKIIDELGVDIRYDAESPKDAYYFSSINLIVINSNLPETPRTLALLHELGHACKHHGNYKLYNQTFALHSKMENEAEEFMIKKMLEAKLNDPDFEPFSFNYINFLESYEIETRYEPVVKEFMTKYLVGFNADNIFF